MDTSETYINQCKKAEKIQKHETSEGDYYARPNGMVFIESDDSDYGSAVDNLKYKGEVLIWLPMQDQLQGMFVSKRGVAFKDLPTTVLLGKLYFFEKHLVLESIEYTSMEQLWLAFVMAEKYNKVWNGTEWA